MRTYTKQTAVLAFILFLLAANASVAVRGDVIQVPGDYATIQEAIDAAAQSGDEIIVAPGTYNEAINLLGKEVYLRSSGGRDVTTIDATGLDTSVVTCTSGETPDTTVEGFTITGGTGTLINGNRFGGGVYVVNGSPVIANVLFSFNTAMAEPNPDWEGSGGAICNVSASPTIFACEFRNNQARGGLSNARGQGGAIANLEGSDADISECLFEENSCDSAVGDHGHGGAIYIERSSPHVSHCSFNRNAADRGGAIASEYSPTAPIIEDCDFIENRATGGGGAIRNNSQSRASIYRCSFTENSASSGGAIINVDFCFVSTIDCSFTRNSASYGGAIYNYNTYGQDWEITGCTFAENDAASEGGAIRNWFAKPLVINCLFVRNSAREGGGLYNEYYCTGLRAINCTFAGNGAEGQGGAIRNYRESDPEFTNCAFYKNRSSSGPDIYSSYNSDPLISSCCIPRSGGSGDNWNDDLGIDGGGNIDADPMFVDPESGDFQLRSGSPCIDAADAEHYPPGFDFDLNGDSRFINDPYITDTGSGDPPIIDMGCYEFQADEHPTLTVSPDPLVAGERAHFVVRNARGEAETYLLYSLTGTGKRNVPGLNVQLDLDQPRRIKWTTQTSADGHAHESLSIPANAAGLDIWFQAAQRNVKSDVVETSVQ